MTNSAIPQNAAQALDAILTAWSESHRLSDEQIETIRASLIKDSEVMSGGGHCSKVIRFPGFLATT